MPMAMHSALAATFTSTNTITNTQTHRTSVKTGVGSASSEKPLRPIAGYATSAKKSGGKTRNAKTSKTTTVTKYDAVSYAPAAFSRRNNKRSSLHTGKLLRLMRVKYSRMKNRLPMRFWIPPVSRPAERNTAPTKTDAVAVAKKCSAMRKGWRRTFFATRPHKTLVCVANEARNLRVRGNVVPDSACTAAIRARAVASRAAAALASKSSTMRCASSSDARSTTSST
mmetsp:Transcript_10837/g.46165  ORF Transcript_10837/g.46165 Transcript_10837/m.46165 type:complete len:226 (-) Transcript_10837:1030-1707(-)